MLERDGKLTGNSSPEPVKSKVEEEVEIEREAEQVEEVEEPSKESERDDNLAGKATSNPVT